jgi:hypothetical protein
MSNINIFISAGATSTEIQEIFVSAIEDRIRGENLIPNTVGRNKFSANSPLKTVIELMDECSGTIIVALERTYFPNGTERRNGKKEKPLTEIKYATSWNQIEAAMAYTKGQPILVIIEEGIKTEGLLEKGYDWYVMSVKPEIAALSTVEFNGVLSSWKKKVEDFANHKREKQLEEKKIDTTSLTIGDLIKGLKPSHLWGILIAIAGLTSGSFLLGNYFASIKASKSDSVNVETQGKIEEDIRLGVTSFFQNQDWLSTAPSIVMGEAKGIVRKFKTDRNTFVNVEREIERRKKEDNNWTFANQETQALALVNYLGLDLDTKIKNEIFLNMPLPEVSKHDTPSK